MSEDDDFELLQIMYETGDLIKLNSASADFTEYLLFGAPTLHFLVKDTDIYLDVFPGVKRLQAHNHSWFRKVHQKGFDRVRANIKPEYIVDELRKQGKHDLAKIILFNLDVYG